MGLHQTAEQACIVSKQWGRQKSLKGRFWHDDGVGVAGTAFEHLGWKSCTPMYSLCQAVSKSAMHL